MNPHVLIVDDEPCVRETLVKVIWRQHLSATAVGTGKEAVAWLATEKCDLVLLDVSLPDYDGLELLVEIRFKFPHLPVMVMSGLADVEDLEQEAKGKGAAGFISKTLPLEQFSEAVLRGLKLQPH